MDVSSEPDVIGEIPSVVVGIFVDHDVVSGPIPVVAKTEVEACDAEVKAAEPEATGAASGQVPDVTSSESAGKAAVFPGMIEVETGVIVPVIVADPLSIVMDVRSLGVTFEIAVAGSGRLVRNGMHGGWTVLGNKTSANGVSAAPMLCP